MLDENEIAVICKGDGGKTFLTLRIFFSPQLIGDSVDFTIRRIVTRRKDKIVEKNYHDRITPVFAERVEIPPLERLRALLRMPDIRRDAR